MTYDLLVTDARLPGADSLTCVGVREGHVAAVAPDLTDGDAVLRAGGALVAPGFVDPHVHLDKALVADSLPPNDSGTLAEAIAISRERKADYTVAGVRDRAIRTVERHVQNGCTRLRSHVDVDTVGGLVPLRGVLAAREACADVADVEVVAFPQEGVVSDPGTEDLLDRALREGADAVGGMPDNERTDADTRRHVDVCLDLAAQYDVPVDMHVDETDDPTAGSLRYLAARTIETGADDVTAGHACALAAYDEARARRVVSLVAEAGLSVVTNPPTNLLLGGRADRHPRRRGITRVDQLREAGVTVAAGQDCVADGFYPYGRGSMLETALLTAHAAHLATPAERTTAWEMVTGDAAAVVGVESGLHEGAPATFNVFPPGVETRTDALRRGAPPATVVHGGRVVAERTVETTLHRED
jgi:cytosine deaminase